MILENILQLESNLRRVAFLGEWSRSMDDARSIASASIVTSPVHVSSNYVGSRKRGRKSISTNELSSMSRHATISDICWWRGGRLSRQLFQCKVLPRGLASKGGRQGLRFPCQLSRVSFRFFTIVRFFYLNMILV